MTQKFDFGGEIVGTPTPEHIQNANLTAFMRQHGITDFDTLMQRSAADVKWFTDAVLKFMDIEFYEPYRQTNQAVNALRSLGLGKGDAVGIYT